MLRCPCHFLVLCFHVLNIWISSWLFRRLKEAGLYSAEDPAMAGRGIILPESVIGQLLPADADEASREALNVIFDVGRQALPGSMRLWLRQLRNKQGISELQTGIASSSLFYPVDLSNTLATHASSLQNRLSRSLVCSKGQVFTNAHPVDFKPSVQKVVRIYLGGGEMFPVSGRIGCTLSSVQFVFLSAFSSKGDKPSIASCCFPIVVFRFGQYFADAEVR